MLQFLNCPHHPLWAPSSQSLHLLDWEPPGTDSACQESATTTGQGMDSPPGPAASALPNAALGTVGLFCCEVTQTLLIQNLFGCFLLSSLEQSLWIYTDANKIRNYCLKIIKSNFKPGVIFYLKVLDQCNSICCWNATRKQRAKWKARTRACAASVCNEFHVYLFSFPLSALITRLHAQDQ